MSIKLNTGNEEFVLDFGGGRIEKIYFNPADPDILTRLDDFSKNAAKRISENDEIPEDGTEQYAYFRDSFIAELNRVFGGDVSPAFKYCSPFAVVNGKYFVVRFIEQITPEIRERAENADKKASGKKMMKHLEKYSK